MPKKFARYPVSHFYFPFLIVLCLFSAFALYVLAQNYFQKQNTPPQISSEQIQKRLANQDAAQVASFSAQVAYFYPSLAGFPPQFDSKTQETQIRQQWQQTAVSGENLLTHIHDKQQLLELHYQLGELYRMGNNLDNPGSWDKSEANFKQILAQDPKNVQAKGALGTLYVNTGPQYAVAAENLFLSALQDNPTPEQQVNLYQGLTFAKIYQGDIPGALKAANAGLAINPQDQQLLMMKNLYEGRGK